MRTAMRFDCADRNVKEEVVSLARGLVSSCVWMLKRLLPESVRNSYRHVAFPADRKSLPADSKPLSNAGVSGPNGTVV